VTKGPCPPTSKYITKFHLRSFERLLSSHQACLLLLSNIDTQYAVVYLGKQSGTNRIVAIKSIKIGQFKDGGFPSPFLSNIRNGYVCHPRNKISSRAAA
jgi:hypothetical protein